MWSDRITLSRLKWIGIAVPLAFLSGLWLLLHSAFESLHDFPGLVLLLLAMAGTIALFSSGVFTVISRLEQRTVDQNRELERRNEELEALLAVGRAASSSLELAEVLDAALEAILDVTSAEAAEVWLCEEGGELVLARQWGLEPAAFRERTRFGRGEGFPGLAAEQGSPIVAHDLPADRRFLRQEVKARGFMSYCAIPMKQRHETVGVLGVAARSAHALSRRAELRLLEATGERVGAAIANARLHARVLDGAVLEERVRLARELHDGLAQVLGYINTQTLAVAALLEAGQTTDCRQELCAMREATLRVYGDVREAILELHVPASSSVGLVPALRRYLEDFSRMAGVAVRLDADEEAGGGALPASVEIQLVRIVQEALSNVRKHAAATTATVRVRPAESTLRLEIEDDGVGFEPGVTAPSGWPRFGLQTMRERAQAVGGSFRLASAPGEGTRISVEIPAGLPGEVARARTAG
jgi:signal transduction histidine kinase